MLAKMVGTLSFFVGIFHLSNDNFLLGASFGFAGIMLFRSEWNQ